MEKSCLSCKRAVDNDRTAVSFACPVCSAELVRCGACRKAIAIYKCASCGFEGP